MTLESMIAAVVDLATGIVPATSLAIFVGAAVVVGGGIWLIKRVAKH